MYPYSHYALALKLSPFFQPDRLSDYLWGAVVPDVRYLAGMPRSQTHLPDEAIRAWLPAYPGLHSFIRGYQVHCLLDDVDLRAVLARAFPFNLLRLAGRSAVSNRQAGALVELHFIEQPPAGEPLSGEHNPILDELGVRPAHSAALAAGLREYLAAPSLQSGLRAFQNTGLLQDGRIDQYLRAFRALERSRPVKRLLLRAVRKSELERLVMEHVRGSACAPPAGNHLPGAAE